MRAKVRQLSQPTMHDVVIDPVRSGNRGHGHAWRSACSNNLRFELGAVSATASAGLGEMVAGVHVSTIYYVDTMVLNSCSLFNMGWPDAYRLFICIAGKSDQNDLS